jgi:hypothetical protein
MRSFIASIRALVAVCSLVAVPLLLAAACGPAPKPEGPIVNDPPAADSCCCKSTPIASPDGMPVYEASTNRMECSSKQGTCVDDVQCQGKAEDPDAVPPPPMTPDMAPIE